MQSTASNLEFKLNVNLRLVKPDFMQSTAVNLKFKLKVIFKLLSCNWPVMFLFCVLSDQSMNIALLVHVLYFGLCFVLWFVVLW